MRILMFSLIGFILLTSCNIAPKNESKLNDSIIQEKLVVLIDNIWERIDKKGEWFKGDSKLLLTTDSISADFADFYNEFISDSIYQREHIQFPVLAAIGDCDTTIQLNESNWKNYNYDFRKDFYNPQDSNVIYQNESKFYYLNYRKEIGLLFRIGFEKRDGKWILTLYDVNAC